VHNFYAPQLGGKAAQSRQKVILSQIINALRTRTQIGTRLDSPFDILAAA
jgi:hypothetical protein